MTEIIVAAAGVANGLFFYLIAKHGADERRRFLAAIQAKDAGEYVAIERATAPRPKKRKPADSSVPPNPIGL